MLSIPRRTSKGDEIVKDRNVQLPRKQRTLLMAVDGKTAVDTYIKFLTSFGDVSSLMLELEQQGLIQLTRHPIHPATPAHSAVMEFKPLAEAIALDRQVRLEHISREAELMQRTLTLISDFISVNFPELIFEVLIELEKLTSLDELRSVLPDYQMAISRKPEVALPHIATLNKILTQ